MKGLIWKKLIVNDTGKAIVNNTKPTVRTAKIEQDNCFGMAYYITIEANVGMSGDVTAVLTPNIEDTNRYMAIHRHSTYWCRPFWGERLCELPSNVQELVFEQNGVYTAILPVCDSIIKTVIRGGADGVEFVVTTNKDGLCQIPEQLSFVVMEGRSATEALKAVARAAAKLLGNGLKMREERPCPEVFEYLGWCSWDAFQIRVNNAGLVEKAKEFKEKNIPIHYAIIDDMWADVPNFKNIPDDASYVDMVKAMHASKLRTFDGDTNRFPDGIQKAVSDIKEAGIPNVGIWFPTTGYWKGLDDGGKTCKELGDCVRMGSNERITVVPEADKAERYFEYLCGKTKQWGADFVKIDNQGFYHNFKDTHTFGESAKAIQGAIEKTAEKYFDGAIINCMGMPSECMFHRTDSAVCRCSDDFKPESREWFAKHILQCAYNGLLQGQYHINDWDMWWTDDEQAVKNSVCRAISGGPIYVSDKLGRTNPEILKPLAFKDGRILRPDNSAIPAEDCIMQNPTKSEKIFKLFNRFCKNGVLAVFNINKQNNKCAGTVCPKDCDLPSGKYAYFEYFSQTGGILEASQQLEVTLDTNDDFKLYTFAPFKDGYAILGRADMYMGVGADYCTKENGTIAVIRECDAELHFVRISKN